jgi:hypothetical protein
MLAAAGHHDLVGLALTDHDHSVIEQALHSIDSAFEHHPELLDYALNILACTHGPAAKPMIDPLRGLDGLHSQHPQKCSRPDWMTILDLSGRFRKFFGGRSVFAG